MRKTRNEREVLEMNPHQYRQLKKLFDARNKGNNERVAYMQGLRDHKITEDELKKEIETRANDGK